jgi:hypothetical protein
VPARVIRECTAALGEPADRYLGVSEMADGTDKANGNKSARGIYNLLYGLISSSPVHASGSAVTGFGSVHVINEYTRAA